MPRWPNLKRAVRGYKEAVDAGDIKQALLLFAPKVKYNRAGNLLNGIDSVSKFYLEQRKLVGRHEFRSVRLVKPGLVRVTGVFRKRDGGQIFFSDLFKFDKHGRIVRRTTKSADLAKEEEYA